jgi:predicted AAA+ superfamily ATPase
MNQIPRKLLPRILYSLSQIPVVFVNGPRQAGKSTLVQKLSHKEFLAEYITFDNTTQMSAAASSPHEFLTAR